MKCLLLLLLTFPLRILGAEEEIIKAPPKHLITIGTAGFGVDTVSSIIKWDKDKSGVHDNKSSSGDLSLNYMYLSPNNIMIGFQLSSSTSKMEAKGVGGKMKTEKNSSEFGFGVGFNFNDDIYNSWWIKGMLVSGHSKEKTNAPSGDEKTTSKYNGFFYAVGKRFNLKSWGLENISYNPSISAGAVKADGDAKDEGMEGMTRFQLDVIQFDIIF